MFARIHNKMQSRTQSLLRFAAAQHTCSSLHLSRYYTGRVYLYLLFALKNKGLFFKIKEKWNVCHKNALLVRLYSLSLSLEIRRMFVLLNKL